MMRTCSLAMVVALCAAAASPLCGEAPFLVTDGAVFGREHTNPRPRPFDGHADITTHTSLYFEVLVPTANGAQGEIDPDTITATLVPEGQAGEPMLLAGQGFASGFSGRILPGVTDGAAIGYGVYIVPAQPLSPATAHTVEVHAGTFDGQTIDPDPSTWTFTTRTSLADPRVSYDVDLSGSTISWQGGFFNGILKPNFNTSRVFDQEDSYDLMSQVRVRDPLALAWSLQRDWPLTADYWNNNFFDGNPNLVREQQTRLIVAVEDLPGSTRLTLDDLPEGPLYGILPGRSLAGDFPVGSTVSIADSVQHELATVVAVDEGAGTVDVSPLATLAGDWILDNARPQDNPDTPGNFTFPLCYLRRHDPAGTPRYYWDRLDDEWDLVHAAHGRRLVVNFPDVPLDLAEVPVPGGPSGNGSKSLPKDWLQWHGFVRQVVFHLIDRYGPATQDFYYSVGNENNFAVFWCCGKDGFYRHYDYTVNAILTAFEDRGLDAAAVRVGGFEAAGLGGRAWLRDGFYHASGPADSPNGIAEENFVCADPRFDGLRAARVEDLCAAHGGRGSPLDFVSIHQYEHAELATREIFQVREDALSIDAAFFDDLWITAFESSPDWIPRSDPASSHIFLGNGYLPSWAADWTHRLLEAGETDPRHALHEAVLTVWPFDYNGQGITAATHLMRVDEDGDTREDRVATVKKDFFNWVELMTFIGREVDPLPGRELEGIRIGGLRSAGLDAHAILLHAHDGRDTGSRETAEIRVDLELSSVPWPVSSVTRWRVDRDHGSPWRAFEQLPSRDLYAPGEIAPLQDGDDLIIDGPSMESDTSGGTLSLPVPLAVNGVTLVEIRERDGDGDGVGDSADNCPDTANRDQLDEDEDGRGAACDCDDARDDLWASPVQISRIRVTRTGAALRIEWSSQATSSGPATGYDLVHGDLLALAADGSFNGAACLSAGHPEPPFLDTRGLPGATRTEYFLVQARNPCGAGGYEAVTAIPGRQDLLPLCL